MSNVETNPFPSLIFIPWSWSDNTDWGERPWHGRCADIHWLRVGIGPRLRPFSRLPAPRICLKGKQSTLKTLRLTMRFEYAVAETQWEIGSGRGTYQKCRRLIRPPRLLKNSISPPSSFCFSFFAPPFSAAAVDAGSTFGSFALTAAKSGWWLKKSYHLLQNQ